MYESYPCSRSSYHDFLSCSGSRGFYVDPDSHYGTDHFHSRESVPCSFARSVYVWCCCQLLRTYQKFLIAFVFSLLISCPAFAEDENYQFQYIGYEAMANQGMDVNQYLIDQYQEERNSEIAQILAEPLANPQLLSADASNTYWDADFNIIGDILQVRYDWIYSYPISYANLNFKHSGSFVRLPDPSSGFYSTLLPDGSDEISIAGVYFENGSEHAARSRVFTPDQIRDESNIFFQLFYVCQSVFSWILDHIGELITFIFGNAFLSVSLLLFMCGAVISFYVRIRRS